MNRSNDSKKSYLGKTRTEAAAQQGAQRAQHVSAHPGCCEYVEVQDHERELEAFEREAKNSMIGKRFTSGLNRLNTTALKLGGYPPGVPLGVPPEGYPEGVPPWT